MRDVVFSHEDTCTFNFPSSRSISPSTILLADVDGDGDFELLVGSLEGSLHVFKGFLSDSHGPWLLSKNLGSLTCLAVGPLLLGAASQQVLASNSEGTMHIFDYSYRENRVQNDMSPVFTLNIPLNVSCMCVSAPMGHAVTDYRPHIGLATADGHIVIMRLEFRGSDGEDDAAATLVSPSGGRSYSLSPLPYPSEKFGDVMSGDDDRETTPSGSTAPHLIPMLKHAVGVPVASLASRMTYITTCGAETTHAEDSVRWEYIVGLEEGTFVALLISESKSDSGLEVEPLHVFPGGGGLPLPMAGWSGGTLVHGRGQTHLTGPDWDRNEWSQPMEDSFRESNNGADEFVSSGGFAMAMLDGRVALVDVCSEGNEVGDDETRDTSGGLFWKTRWCHQLPEAFFCLAGLPYEGEDGTAEGIVACSWSGKTYVFGEGGTGGIVFDAAGFIDQPLQAFTAGRFAIQQGSNQPVLVYVSSTGEILVYHYLWEQVGSLETSSNVTFHSRICELGGMALLRRVIENADEDLRHLPSGMDLNSVSPSLRVIFNVLLREEPAELDTGCEEWEESFRGSIKSILRELDDWENVERPVDLSSYPWLRRALGRFALMGQLERDHMRDEARSLRNQIAIFSPARSLSNASA